MSRPYATDEQYERWFITECCRCGRRKNKAGSWPDGHVCRTCLDRAVRTRGTCPGCGQERALPGRRPGDDAAVCTDCAGFSQSFACARCGFEGKLHGGRLCSRCALADRLADLLDDGSGRIRPELVPLADSLLAMDKPLSGLNCLWTRKGQASSPEDLLRRLGRGEIELTHEAFNRLQPWRAAGHLRELLMACGALPAVDKQVCSFERWLPGYLASITDDGHAQIIRRFATWEVLPRLRARAEKKPVTPSGRRYAGDQVKRATAFLQWLSGRGLTLPGCRQADIDAWYAENNEHARMVLRVFLQWCMASGLTGRFRLPATVIRHAAPLPDHERVSQLGRVLTSHDLPLRARVAAAIVLLYAQPLSRIVRITISDVIRDGDQVRLRLGEPPSPVPAPVADLLLRWIGNRDNMNTATNRNSPWLFPRPPGRPADEPRRSRRASQRHRRSHNRRARLSDPPARPADARTRRGRRPQLPPGHHRQASRPGSRNLEPLRPRRSPAATTWPETSRRRLMTASSLPAALRAGADSLSAPEAATGLIIARASWLARDDFARFIPIGTRKAGEGPQEAGT